MQLISQTAVEGRPGPNFPEAYPRIEGLSFNDPRAFTQGQPFDTFAKLRTASPVCWHPEPGDFPGFWAVTRHADVMRVNGDPATFSSQRGGILMDTPKEEIRHVLLGRASFDTMINMDAPQHTRIRHILQPAFTPRAVQRRDDDALSPRRRGCGRPSWRRSAPTAAPGGRCACPDGPARQSHGGPAPAGRPATHTACRPQPGCGRGKHE